MSIPEKEGFITFTIEGQGKEALTKLVGQIYRAGIDDCIQQIARTMTDSGMEPGEVISFVQKASHVCAGMYLRLEDAGKSIRYEGKVQ